MDISLRSCVQIVLLFGFHKVASASVFADGLAQQAPIDVSPSTERLKVPGASNAYYCDDPAGDVFQISRLDFIPTNPRVGFYQDVRFIGHFVAETGDVPWLNVTGTINGRPELSPIYYSPLCDIDVFQDVTVPVPGANGDTHTGPHRSCPPSIHKGYAVVSAPPMPLRPDMVPTGKYEIRAEATAQNGKRIFCVEGTFNVTSAYHRPESQHSDAIPI